MFDTSESFSNSDIPSSFTASHNCVPLWSDYYNTQYTLDNIQAIYCKFTWEWKSLLPKCSHFQPILRCSIAQCSGLYWCRRFHCSFSSTHITLCKIIFCEYSFGKDVRTVWKMIKGTLLIEYRHLQWLTHKCTYHYMLNFHMLNIFVQPYKNILYKILISLILRLYRF